MITVINVTKLSCYNLHSLRIFCTVVQIATSCHNVEKGSAINKQ